MALRARTKPACEIAGIDPLRLNEAVFAGHFPCAPETQAGRARVFDVDEIVAARIFADKMRIGLSTSSAGELACRALQEMRQNPGAEWVTFIWGLNGSRVVTAGTFLKEEETLKPIPEKFYQDAINVGAIRRHVIERLEEESSIVGEG